MRVMAEGHFVKSENMPNDQAVNVNMVHMPSVRNDDI